MSQQSAQRRTCSHCSPATKFYTRLIVMLSLCFILNSVASSAPTLDAINRGKNATVLVDAGFSGTGTGFCIRQDGLFVTNAHVVESFGPDEVIRLYRTDSSGNIETIQTHRISIDSENDLALLKSLKPLNHTPVELGDIASVFETMSVTGIGYPFGRSLSVEGQEIPDVSLNVVRISAMRKSGGVTQLLQLDGSINPGHSGGPILDDSGKVVGVIVSGIPGSSLSIAIPVNTLQEFLTRPGTVINIPDLNYSQRHEEVEIGVTLYPFSKDQRVQKVQLRLPSTGIFSRLVNLEKQGDRYLCKTSILPPSKEDRVQVVFSRGQEMYHAELVPPTIKIGQQELSLLDIRVIEKRDDVHIVTLNSGEKLAGQIESWDVLATEELTTDQVADVDRIDCFVTGHLLPSATVEVVMQTTSGTESSQKFEYLFGNIPTSTTDDFTLPTATTNEPPQQVELRNNIKRLRREQAANIEKWLKTKGKGNSNWQVLPIDQLQCTGKPKVTPQKEGSILLTGKKPVNAVYNISATSPVKLSEVTAFMLKLLPHSSLPKNGPGRMADGRGRIKEFEAYFYLDGKRIPIQFTRVCKNTLDREYPSERFDMSHVIDGNERPYWYFTADPLKEHEAVFVISEESRKQMAGQELLIRIKNFYSAHLGHFRLYVTTDKDFPMPPTPEGEILSRIDEYQRGERFASDPHFVDYVNGGAPPFQKEIQQLESLTPTPQGSRREINLALNTKLARIPDLSAKILDELEIEFALRGQVWLELHSKGLLLTRQSGELPGIDDPGGRYVLVNGQRWILDWYDQESTEPYLIRLGDGEWKLDLDVPKSSVSAKLGKLEDGVRYVQLEKPTGSNVVNVKFRLIKQSVPKSLLTAKAEPIEQPSTTFALSDYIADEKILPKDLNQMLTTKSGTKVEVNSRYPQGYIVGPVLKGMTLTLQYQSGTWTTSPNVPPLSPEDFSPETSGPDSKLNPRLAIAAVNKFTGETHILKTIDAPTSKAPFQWTADQNYDQVVLRIADPKAGVLFTTKNDRVIYQASLSK